MADAKPIKLKCKIHDIKESDKGTLISVQYKRGSKVWYKAWQIKPDRPISMEQFIKSIASQDPWPRDEDFIKNIKDEKDREFEIAVDRPIKDQGLEQVVSAGMEPPHIPIQQPVASPPGSLVE